MILNFLLIGAMKCATTSLLGVLRCHPRVAVSNPKEPEFLCKDEISARGWSCYDRILILSFEDFVERPADVMKRCYDFLGVDPRLGEQDRFLASHVSPKKRIDGSLIQRLQRVPLARNLKNLARGLARTLMPAFPGRCRSAPTGPRICGARQSRK